MLSVTLMKETKIAEEGLAGPKPILGNNLNR
jgi:hypothetical protein